MISLLLLLFWFVVVVVVFLFCFSTLFSFFFIKGLVRLYTASGFTSEEVLFQFFH